jgi:hypothetical protein
MSKMDELRAMREARYDQSVARASKRTRAMTVPEATPKAAEPRPAAEPEASEEGLCGHRAISGRTCTREHGHAAKSHRYA